MFKPGWIVVILIFAVVIIYDASRGWIIRNSKMPQAVFDFPVYETTEEEFNSLREEIEPFFVDALENRRSELSLTAEQLNCMSTRGVNSKKGGSGLFPSYYEIDDGKLIEKDLSYPHLDSVEGYRITVRATEFAGTMYTTELILVNDCPPSGDDSGVMVSHIKQLSLFIYICYFDRKKVDVLAKKLTIVEIKDHRLILRI